MYKINIFVTNECNAKILNPLPGAPGVCDFCFRPIESIISSEKMIERIINSLDLIEVREPITLTGGEPLVSKYISFLIEMLKEKNHRISLNTNGLLLSKNEEILSKINYICLPFDGHCAELADYYRGEGYYQISQNAYKLAHKYNLPIGVHTLVTPHNILKLEEMGNYLSNQPFSHNIWYWYIKRFKKINHALYTNTTQYELNENLYQQSIFNVKTKFSKMFIGASERESKGYTTLYISLDGNVFIYKKGQAKNTLIGNVMQESLNSIILHNFL
ncbi:MAG: radical SAM protein [Clostridia bacterium]|nr:radical SAM protein [Clostridia bacterium]